MDINVDKFGTISLSGEFIIGYNGAENIARMGKYRFSGREDWEKLEEAVKKAREIKDKAK